MKMTSTITTGGRNRRRNASGNLRANPTKTVFIVDGLIAKDSMDEEAVQSLQNFA